MLSAMSNIGILVNETANTDSHPHSLVPEHNRVELLIAFAVFVGAFVYLWPLRNFVSFNADEGITLLGGERILRGQLPYRDFFTFYTPGSFYQTAILFKLFGTSIVVARTALLAYTGTFAAITYLLTRRMYCRSTAIIAALLVIDCMPSRFLVLHNWDSTLYALVAVYCAQRLLDTHTRFWSFSAGLAAALTFLTEQSKGAGLLLGLGIAVAVFLLTPRGRQRVQQIANLWPAATGLGIPLAFTFAYFASQHATKTMLDAWLWPLQHYTIVNRVPYGFLAIDPAELREMYTSGAWSARLLVIILTSPTFLIPALTLLILAFTLYSIVLRCNTDPSKALDLRVLGGCVLFGIFLSTLATGRADFNHLLYLTPLFMYLVPSIFDLRHRSMSFLYSARPFIACLLLVSFSGFSLITILKALAPSTKFETRRGTVKLGYPDEVLRYVQDNVPEGQHLYVHPYQALYSFMSGTVNPTRYDFLQPGMVTPDQYQSAIHDLALDQTPVVLLDPDFSNKIRTTWPSTPAETLAADPVTDYILQHYHACRFLNSNPPRLWSFYYMVRKDLPCPLDHLSPLRQLAR
jgi:4-amino-4-deoxy-L-arabinose transferase-like glycosyltransferase